MKFLAGLSGVKRVAIGVGGLGYDSRADQITHGVQRLGITATLLRSCVVHCPGAKPWKRVPPLVARCRHNTASIIKT